MLHKQNTRNETATGHYIVEDDEDDSAIMATSVMETFAQESGPV